MAAPLIFTEREQAFLRELVRNKIDFMVVGLAAAALQGAPAVTQDIDLWFRDFAHPGLKKALDRVGGVYVPPTASTPPMLAGKSVALFDIVLRMDGLEGFEKELPNAIEVAIGRTKVKVLSLDRIIASKKAANREKDRLVLPVLESTAAVLRAKDQGRQARARRILELEGSGRWQGDLHEMRGDGATGGRKSRKPRRGPG